MLNQLLPRERMPSIGERSEVFRLHIASQAPTLRQPAMPLASNSLAFAVVIVLGVGELLLVIGALELH